MEEGDRIIYLNPNQIKSSHGRKAKKGKQVKRLARSIGANGIIQPPVVTPHEDGEYIVVAGERRVEAAKEAGLQQVPCLLKSRCSALMSIAENQDRVDLDPIEKAEAYARGVAETGSQKSFAQKIRESESSVSTTLSLLNLHPAIIANTSTMGFYARNSCFRSH
jgi:ParB family chromosome partitioning protein